jgi:hypothetical protein
MIEITRVQSDAGDLCPALKEPPCLGNTDRAYSSYPGPCAPADYRGRDPGGLLEQPHGSIVFAETEAGCRSRFVCSFSRQPGWRHEASRLQPEPPEQLHTTMNAIAGGCSPESQEFALTFRPAPRSPLVNKLTRKTNFVVPLTMKCDLGTVGGPGPHPLDKGRIFFQGPLAMPVGNYQERRYDAAIRT